MKKIFYISLILLSGITANSCSDDLETYSPGALQQETAIRSSNDLKQLLNTAYAQLNSRYESEFVSVFTDEVGIGYDNGGQGISEDYVYFMTPSATAPGNFWASRYAALATLNRVISFSEGIVPTNERDKLIKKSFSCLPIFSDLITSSKVL